MKTKFYLIIPLSGETKSEAEANREELVADLADDSEASRKITESPIHEVHEYVCDE